MVSPVVVELKATSSEFMAKMKEARAEVTKLGTESSGKMAKFAAVGKGALLGTAGAALAVGVASLKLAGDFQQSMTQLVTGAGEAQKNMGLVSAGILDLSTHVGYSAQELAKGMYAIESAGYHGASGLNVLKAAAEGARAGNAEMATVADALTTALNAYHLPASKAIAVTNQLIATEQSGKLTMEDLAGSLGSVVPAAAAVHLSLSETLGAIATMTSTGTGAANAATYLRQTILQLSNPTAKARTEMENLGLSSIDVSKNLGKRGLTGTLDLLTAAIEKKMGPSGTVLIESLKKQAKSTTNFQKILANLSPAQQTYIGALADMVGGTKSMQAALELSGENATRFAANVKHVSEASKGAGKDVTDWDKVQQNFNLKLENAKNYAEKLGIELGTKLIPIVLQVATDIGKVVKWFEKHKTASIALAGAIGGPLVVAIGAYLAVAVPAAAATIAAMAPVLLLAAACAGLAVAAYELYKHWGTVWTFIKQITGDAIAWIIRIFRYGFVDPILTFFGTILEGAAKMFGWVPGIGGKLKAAVKAFDSFKSGVDSTLQGVANAADGWGEKVAQGFAAGVRSQAHLAVAAVGSMAVSANKAARLQFKIASPSKVYAEMGANVALGFAQGVRSHAYHAQSAVAGMLGGASVSGGMTSPALPSSTFGSSAVYVTVLLDGQQVNHRLRQADARRMSRNAPFSIA